MPDPTMYKILIDEIPSFKDEIISSAETKDIKRLHNSVHRMVGGLEYFKEHKTLLAQAKKLNDGLQNAPENFDFLQNDIDNLLKELEKLTTPNV